MKLARPLLLVSSVAIVLFLLGGGFAVKVGAGDNSYQQVVLFSEVLSLVADNYVDAIEPELLLSGAYEGMLAGLDSNGAYLTPDEVREWKVPSPGASAHPGVSVLKAGRSLQVVAVEPGSPAETAGIQVGDQIRSIDGRLVRDLSLSQAWRLLLGRANSPVHLDLLHPMDGFRREQLEVQRELGFGPAYELEVQRGVGVLRIRDMGRLPVDALAEELRDVRSRGVEKLLLDVRNVADLEPRQVAGPAGLFASGTLLNLRDRSGRLLETLEADRPTPVWPGWLAVLVNGATAGSAEALAGLVRSELDAPVLGESTYGLGAESKLYELETGAGLVVSAALWETPSGSRWNGEGLEPDELIRGQGTNYSTLAADQLERALEWVERQETIERRPKVAA